MIAFEHFRARKGILRLFLIVGSMALMASCGQKGPLYVVGQPKNATWPYGPLPATPKPPVAPASAGRAPSGNAPTDLPASSDDNR